MESKLEMSIFTDKLMKQIQGYAQTASKSLEKLQKELTGNAKEIAIESSNEISKMLYRIKDFEQVYNISENLFKPNFDEFNVKESI